ncbi:MAG: hypothetical protein ACYDEQ_02175 [Desulfocucumaceae bacterium]
MSFKTFQEAVFFVMEQGYGVREAISKASIDYPQLYAAAKEMGSGPGIIKAVIVKRGRMLARERGISLKNAYSEIYKEDPDLHSIMASPG